MNGCPQELAGIHGMTDRWQKAGFWFCLFMACLSAFAFFFYERSRQRDEVRERAAIRAVLDGTTR